ncbi:site-specific integrase [[Mycobacterium] zoologicum]|uniref:site-specific integrase n=1 Tax=[Mycobacterium] zoologicum TaxID=2872311 RepID=UPI002BF8D179|nr:tyrosine-type recombinase/integrase [Mycolicibacter sp. MYC101]MEB3065044.1 tyrosine-type recombinase/integrase [Mycolicibacter sp. MYC101]
MADGRPDIEVLEFFRSPVFQSLAAGSQESYAPDIQLFLSFLSVQDVDWRTATFEHLADYEFWRRRDPQNRDRVGAATFSRDLAAIKKFYDWHQWRGNVATSPVTMGKLSSVGDSVRRDLQPSAVRSVQLKWLTPRAYKRWRDVGLGGYRADGRRDATWRGRNDGRNLAFAEALWSSGLRLREAGTLVLDEIPSADSHVRYAKARVGQAVAKGRGRDFWISTAAIKGIGNYIISTRAAAVHRAHREGRYDALTDIKIVDTIDKHRRVHFTNREGTKGTIPLDSLDATDRLNFYITTDRGLEPWMLWLSEAGLPMPYRTWEAIFSTANKRCQTLGVDIHCHPHMLRHSFALRMLVTLIYAHERKMGITPAERREYRHIFGDPWVLVQTLLGHVNVETTRNCYLEPVSGLQVDLFLNDDVAADASIADFITHIAATAPGIVDTEEQ